MGVGGPLGGASSSAVKGWPEFHPWWPPCRSARWGRHAPAREEGTSSGSSGGGGGSLRGGGGGGVRWTVAEEAEAEQVAEVEEEEA